MNQLTSTYPEFVYQKGLEWGNARVFHEWLLYHPKLSKYSRDIDTILKNESGSEGGSDGWNDVFYAVDLMERAHWDDIRKRNSAPYIIHQFEIIRDYLGKISPRRVSLHRIVVLLLHDVIEDHPEYWREIFDKFGIKTFRDVLIIGTGGIDNKFRSEILDFFQENFDIANSQPGGTLHDIVHMLSPMDPYEKLQKYAPQYSDSGVSRDNYKRIEKAIAYYAMYFFGIDPRKPHAPIYNKEYIALANYLYMKKSDVLSKLDDMLNNMGDMTSMGPQYIEKRQIKAYILMAKLRIFKLKHASDELYSKFQSSGHPMLSEKQIEKLIQQKIT